MGATAGGGDVSWAGEDGAFVDGVGETFNAQIDEVGAENGYVNSIGSEMTESSDIPRLDARGWACRSC